MRRRAGGLLAVLAAVLMTLTWRGVSLAVAGAEPPRAALTLEQLGLGDQTAQGGAPVLTFFFPGPGDHALAPSGSMLRLVFSHSPLLLERYSTMTVQFNESMLTAVWLGPENATRSILDVPVPTELVMPGTNVVRLRFLMKLRDSCEDPRNPALFTRIHKESGLHYQYADGFPLHEPSGLSLARFPAPLARDGALRGGETVFVLPDDPTQAELSAAATIAATMGRLVSTDNLRFSVVPVGRFVAEEHGRGNDLVLIGTAGRNQMTALLEQLRGLSPPEPGTGSLRLVPSFADARRVALVVSGDTDESVLRAAIALGDTRTRAGFGGDMAFVREVDTRLAPAPLQLTALTLTFQELGQESVTVSGLTPGGLRIAFTAPALGAEQGGKLRLWLAHSTVLDERRSHIRVALNGTALTSVALTERNRGRTAVDIDLPAKTLRPGVNTLGVDFYMHLPPEPNHGEECSEDTSDRAWVSIFGDSNITIGGGALGGTPDVASFPYPFVHSGGMAGTLLVTGTDAESLQNALRVAAILGRTNTAPNSTLGMSAPHQLSEEQRAGFNLLVLGRPSKNTFIAELGQALPLRFHSDSDRLVQDRNATLASIQAAGSLGVFQIVPSPFDARRWVGVLTATTPRGMEYVLKALQADPDHGTVLLATDADNATALTLVAKAPTAIEVQRARARRSLLPGLTATVALITAGLVGWRLYITSRRTREARI